MEEFRLGDTDAAGSLNLDKEQHGASIAVMNVVNKAQMVVDGGGVTSRTTFGDTCGVPTSRERLPVLTGHRRSVTIEDRNSSSVKVSLLFDQILETRNLD